MANETALYMKFPCVLRDKLLNGELHFPPNTRFAYEKIFTYRAVDSCIKSGAEIQKRTGGQPETAGLPSLTSHGKISLTSLGKDSIIK